MRPLVVLCLLELSAHLACVEADHKCGHIPPQRVGYSTTTSSRSKRQATERQPIRIVPWYYEEDFNQLTPELRTKYLSVVNQSISYLSSFLRVDRLTQGITLQRFCDHPDLESLNPFDHCTPDHPCQDTFCAFTEFPVPEEHLKACKTCDTLGSTNCLTEGQDGPGVADADFVVYVAAKASECGEETLAYASHGFQDKGTDRPIAGAVNLCPSLADEEDIDSIVQTVIHELTHALVFAEDLMPFFRDENDNPRTPRDQFGLPSLGNSTIFTFRPSEDTILEEIVQKVALNGVYDINTTKVVTPAVLREARRHFNCPTLNGLELEDLGGSGTQYSHWKKRLVENEAMTGVRSSNDVFSRLTFALYEDSGWYDVDYSVASSLRFGQCLGCDFAEKSCFSYGLNREPFCREQESTPFDNLGGRTGGANTSCTYDHLAVATCDLVDVNFEFPIQYQYFSDPNLGGSELTNEHCPINSAVLHCQRQRDLLDNVFMETVGPNSKCVDFEIRTNWEYNSATVSPINGGACYEVSCASEDSVAITVGRTTALCQSAGQEITVPAGAFSIVIICPAFEDICWEKSTTCSSNTSAPPSAPPSGLSQDGVIAIGVTFGLVFLLAVIMLVIVLVMCSHRGGGGKGSLRDSKGLPEAVNKMDNGLALEEMV